MEDDKIFLARLGLMLVCTAGIGCICWCGVRGWCELIVWLAQ